MNRARIIDSETSTENSAGLEPLTQHKLVTDSESIRRTGQMFVGEDSHANIQVGLGQELNSVGLAVWGIDADRD